MTREEAIGHLRVIITYAENDGYTELAIEALKMAIQALEQEPVLDKIRAEIEQEPYVSKMEVLEIIDRYTEESKEGAE